MILKHSLDLSKIKRANHDRHDSLFRGLFFSKTELTRHGELLRDAIHPIYFDR